MDKGMWLVTTNSVLDKIRRFFRKIFRTQKETTVEIKENKKINNEFKDYIVIKKDEEKEKMLKFQEEFVKGNIREEKMTEEEYEKLSDLYDEQILELETNIAQENAEIERDKQKIIEMIKELKNT